MQSDNFQQKKSHKKLFPYQSDIISVIVFCMRKEEDFDFHNLRKRNRCTPLSLETINGRKKDVCRVLLLKINSNLIYNIEENEIKEKIVAFVELHHSK